MYVCNNVWPGISNKSYQAISLVLKNFKIQFSPVVSPPFSIFCLFYLLDFHVWYKGLLTCIVPSHYMAY